MEPNFLQATRSESAGTTSVSEEISKYFLSRRLEIRRESLLVTRLQLPKGRLRIPVRVVPATHSERPAEVRFSTRLQAHQVFTSAPTGEVDFTPALHS